MSMYGLIILNPEDGVDTITKTTLCLVKKIQNIKYIRTTTWKWQHLKIGKI
jgi:hypothetical protein